MAEIIYGTFSSILFKLGSDACQKFKAYKELELDLKKLQSTLGPYKAGLLDADQAAESSDPVKDWISRLQDAVYDADDLLDEFQYERLRQKVRTAGRARRVRIKPFSFFKRFLSRSKMSHRVKEIRERLKELTEEIPNFESMSKIIGRNENTENMGVGNTWSRRETDSYVVKSEIIGRDKNKEDIINLLLKPTSNQVNVSVVAKPGFGGSHQGNVSIVAIAGFGGLGKTALAQLVYNEAKIESHFSPKIWVCVSDQFDIKLLIKNILKSAGVTVDESDRKEILQKKLKDVLGGKRYLIVLDDVWNDDSLKWDKFSKYLLDGAPGSKILVTTRNRSVALAIGINSPYVLEGLNGDQSWDLFKHIVSFRGQNKIDTKLELIGKEIVERCKGIPLAIKTLASLLRQNPNENFWLSIKENRDVWKSLENEDGIFSVLKLSYNHLAIHLKPCFAFCSIFPKDFDIPKDKLIQLWNAEGYIQSSIRNERSVDLGVQYYNDLLSRSFFQEEKEDKTGRITCKMHDLIHDLAQLIAGSSFYVVKDDKQKIPKEVRHLFVECNPSQKFETKRIRTILISPDIFIEKEVFQSISSLNCLRIINRLPKSMYKFKHLRFLDLSHYHMEVLPHFITNLHNLQTLLLYDCQYLKKLPKDISKLISLEYLDIKGCEELKYLPKGLGDLTSLQRLSDFIVNIDEKEFSSSATLNELRDLNYLGGQLDIKNLDMVRNVELESNEANLRKKKHLESLQLRWNRGDRNNEANLKEKKHLESLQLRWNRGDRNNEKDELLLDNLEPHPNLKKLEIYGYQGTRFSRWLSSITNLVSIKMEDSWCCQQLPGLDHHLPFLESLSLYNFSALEYVADEDPSSSSTTTTTIFFPSLKELKLFDCENLKGWWRGKNKNEGSTSELPCFPCLSTLTIRNCPILTSMPLFPFLEGELEWWNASIRPLQQTLMMKTNNTSTTSASSASSSRSSSTAPPLSNLKTLKLDHIHDVETLPVEFLLNLTSLEYLEFEKCNKLESLPPQRTHCPTLTSLRTLKIHFCDQVKSLPGMHRLTSLEALTLVRLSALEYVADDGIGKEEDSCSSLSCSTSTTTTTTMFFPSLKKLELCDCVNLKGWWRNNENEGATSELPCFPCLSTLTIRNCPILTSMPLFPSLEGELEWRNASIRPLQQTLMMKTNNTSTASASSSRSSSTAPPLSKLKTLNLAHIHDVETLPEEFLLNLTSLEYLEFKECNKLESLPPQRTHCPALTSLRTLKIHFCDQVKSLPEMHRLTSLEALTLGRLSALEYVADDGIGKEEDFSSSLSCSTSTTTTTMFFPSLNRLYLEGCYNLKGWWRRKNKNEGSTSELPCFPCLSSLTISSCPNLTSMPLFPSLEYLNLQYASIRLLQQTLMMKTNNTSTASASSASSSGSSSTAPPLSNLKELNLEHIHDVETLPEEFFLNLTSLEYLTFEECNNLESLRPRSAHCLASLKVLQLSNCPNLRALPEWIPTLTSLESLRIAFCTQVPSLPGGMRRLTSLKELEIKGCPQLSETCKEESGIDWPQIAQIPYIFVEDRRVGGKADS